MAQGGISAAQAMAPSKIDDSRASFVDLSPEIRNTIYSYALIAVKGCITIRGKPVGRDADLVDDEEPEPQNLSPGVLRSCRMIHQEATPVLYGSNNFHILYDGASSFFVDIASSRRFLRQVEFQSFYTQGGLKQCFTHLKEAKQLQLLVLNSDCTSPTKLLPDVAVTARLLGPLIKELHKSRKGTDQKPALDVVAFAEMKDPWTGSPSRFDPEWQAVGEQIKAKLRKTLK